MIYAYKCRSCGARADSTRRADALGPCPQCSDTLRRVWSVSLPRPMQEHWNPAVNMPISDPRQFERELSKQSDIATDNTGIEHRYVPIGWNELAQQGDSL